MLGDPDLPTRADYEEMSELIVEAFEKRSSNKRIQKTNLDFSKLTEIMSWKLEQKNSFVVDVSEEIKRSQIPPNVFSRSAVSKALTAGQILYDHLPNVYHLFRPDGYQTFSIYASKYSNGSQEITQVLALIKKIWNEFPFGVSTAEFKTFCARGISQIRHF